ncbi:MAG: hypothetical protein JXJ20_14375 [Anaerolineae bacterium]|nr:hypothetical protein [Anaerolineae bacterium]
MKTRLIRYLLPVYVIALVLGGLIPVPALAQDGGERYVNAELGIAFDLPDGWDVAVQDDTLAAAAPLDLEMALAGDVPQGLVLRIAFGTFSELGITDATQLPDMVSRLVSSEITPPSPEPAQWGNASGYQLLVTLPDEGLTTRVALLAVAGGRVAVVRGLAPPSVWDSSAGAQFDALVQTLFFSLPVTDQDYLASVISNDGGVFWHLQEPQPESGRVVRAGGITYDMFDVMYMALGPGGVMSINILTGQMISYMGPWINGDFVDIAIGPDTRLYLANTADDTDNAITVIDRAGNYNRGWGTRGDADGQFAPGMPRTIAVTKGGEVWTVSEGHSDGFRDRLYKFDTLGNLLLTVDLATINPDLSGVRLDNNMDTGALYLVGAAGNLNVVDTNGQALVINLAQEILADTTPLDIAIAPNDNVILAVPAPGLDGFGFLELSVAGHLLDVFGLPYNTARGGPYMPGEYLNPGGLIVGPDGMLYWSETNPDSGYTQVQAFSFRGDGRIPLGDEVVVDDPTDTDAIIAADPAKGGGDIVYGDTVRASLNNRYPVHKWTFIGDAGDHIIITMIDASGEGYLDPKIVLKREGDDREIAANDDVGQLAPEGMSEQDARLEFDLPSNATYIIEATRFGGRGEYILTLEKEE